MRRVLGVLAVVASLTLVSCRDDRVTITYHPVPGSTFAYSVHVESSTVTSLPGTPSAPVDLVPADLTARQRVLDTNNGITRVQVTLQREGTGSRTFVMRFDRAAQLTAVESVEGIPAEALGPLGLSEIFPEAAGAPPDRPLRPGDRWTIGDQVQLAGMAGPSRLSGSGHLVRLGVVDGHDTATVESSTSLPLVATSQSGGSTQTLRGTQTTTITVLYDLATGAVRHSTATTKGTFDLTLGPRPGQAGTPIDGTLTVEVRSEIRRVD